MDRERMDRKLANAYEKMFVFFFLLKTKYKSIIDACVSFPLRFSLGKVVEV